MRKSRFTESQIVGIIGEADAGISMSELSRKHGVHANTIRLWRSKYGGLEVSDLARLKQLEAENSQMERIIARQALEINAMKNLFSKTAGAFTAKRSGEGVAERRVEPTPGVFAYQMPTAHRPAPVAPRAQR